ncbi:MAG: hypothetical protein ACI97A_002632 [Planctomycetota bacterium]|jgi:hypothetical protein
MSEDCVMPEPSPEHALIQESVGVWDVKCRFFMGPDSPPGEMDATDTISAIGPYWNAGRFEGDFMGMPFIGASQFGYLPEEKCYVSTWIDAMSTFLFVLKGNMDDATKTLHMTGEGPNPSTGEMVPQRVSHEFFSDNSHKMSMFMTTEHGEVKSFEMDYARRS